MDYLIIHVFTERRKIELFTQTPIALAADLCQVNRSRQSANPPELSALTTVSGVVYSHYTHRHIAAEQCVAVHGLTYLLAGRLRVVEASESQTFCAGSLLFTRKNFLAKFIKEPPEDGAFRAITVTFDAATLRAHGRPAGLAAPPPPNHRAAVQPLVLQPLLTSFFATLQSSFDRPLPGPLVVRLQQQALSLLLQAYPALDAVLFAAGPPGKIDLEAFMRQHFRFNASLPQLAYLTGRSLASFKRDFTRIFAASPARWLRQRRLEEAYYLLREERKRPSEVYHEVGFESLAHFSNAFKQLFGYPPSAIPAGTAAPGLPAHRPPSY